MSKEDKRIIKRDNNLISKEIFNSPNAKIAEQLKNLPSIYLENTLKDSSLNFINEINRVSEQAKLSQIQFSKALNPFAEFSEKLNKLYTSDINTISSMFSYENPLKETIDQIQKQMIPFQESMKCFNQIKLNIDYDTISKSLSGINNFIQSIPPEHLIKFRLHSENWLVNDEKLLNKIKEESYLESDLLAQYIIKYYKNNGWSKLRIIVICWDDAINQDRIDIFLSAINNAKTTETNDIHFLTVPALIAQIDGLIRDLYSLLPKEIKKRIESEITENLPDDIKAKRHDTRQDEIIGSIAELVDYWSAEILQEVIYNSLFKSSNKITEDQGYSLYRHKIMHGDKDFLNYGNEENFVRLILYADFIVRLIREVKLSLAKRIIRNENVREQNEQGQDEQKHL